MSKFHFFEENKSCRCVFNRDCTKCSIFCKLEIIGGTYMISNEKANLRFDHGYDIQTKLQTL
jgi:hypothetical protein